MPIDVKRVEQLVGGRTIGFETGKLAKQADGAVVVNCGETVILVTAVASQGLREGIDFFPLTVDIEERMYAVGRIPGSFFRTEGRPTEKATLTARLTDRPIRPAFADWFRHEVQIIATILQVDENPWDVHCITGASTALLLGGIPFAGPIAGVRVAHIRNSWVVNPTFEEMENATVELVVAGRATDDGDVDILMIEAGGFERTLELIEGGAPKPDESVLAQGIEASKAYIRDLCGAQRRLAAQVQIPQREWIRCIDFGDDVMDALKQLCEAEVAEALTIVGKQERAARLDEIKSRVFEQLAGRFEGRDREFSYAYKDLQKKIVRKRIVTEGRRIDGRGPADLRPLYTEVGLFPRVHGTGLFQRGETQAVSFATLGTLRMEMQLDTISPEESKRYMHSYRMPPFSLGETGRLGGPRRRETGHGALAEKAVLPVVPDENEFPYAIRVVSEVLESNGSTSMASTCASTLALMDAGVPLKAMVGGIAMGLVAEDGNYVPLTDILGAEDAYGDMDFKVAGTSDYITALQLDTKTTGIPSSVLAKALEQAKQARLKILEAMRQAIDAPRAELSPYAPRVLLQQIPVDKIGEVIGPKGKMINQIQDDYGVEIHIEDDGRVFIASTDSAGAEAARKTIQDIAVPRMFQIGEQFDGTVVKTTDFGAFVNIAPGRDGLVHISKLGAGRRIKSVEDVVKQGDRVRVEITEIRADGKLSLSPVVQGEDPSEGVSGQRSQPEPEPAQ